MIILIILILSELVTFLVFWQHWFRESKKNFFISVIINILLSIYIWILYLQKVTYKGIFDEPGHIWNMIVFNGALCAILVPRVFLGFLHFTGKLIRIRRGTHIRFLTNSGIITWIVLIVILACGAFIGRFNFKTEEITVKIDGLKKDLEGLTIVHISDIHISSFYNQSKKLENVMTVINSYKPDILINSGDFISYGWREFGRNDTILSKAKAKYGNFAVLGNHDIGTYHPGYDSAGIDSNIVMMKKIITTSGYRVLNDECTIINIGNTRVRISGVVTKGRHPHMIHGDLVKAISGCDSSDFDILISHDPNHWKNEVLKKSNIDITFSGHTHGMQMGILTKGYKWSPSEYFYPEWNGLYQEGKQYLYVNRGLGVLAIPFRIWMPPEISILRLVSG